MSSKILYLTKRRERGNNVHERKKERKKERKEDLIADANAGSEKQGKEIETKKLHEKIQERPKT